MGKEARRIAGLPGVVSTVQARECGAAQLRSRRPGMTRESRGIWHVEQIQQAWPEEGDPSPELRLLVARAEAMVSLYPDALITHETAAALWGFPLPGRFPETIHLQRPVKTSRTKRPGVRVWRVRAEPGDRAVHPATGLPLTSMRRTLLNLAASWSLEDLVAAIDWMVRTPRWRFEQRTEPHDTLSQLADWIEGQRCKRGTPLLRQALALARVGSDSPMETRVRLLLGAAGLPEPVCNGVFPVSPNDAGWLRDIQPDLAYPAWKVAVEYQGEFHASADAMRRDISKKSAMEASGWMVIQVHGAHMRQQPDWVVSRVRRALVSRGWRP